MISGAFPRQLHRDDGIGQRRPTAWGAYDGNIGLGLLCVARSTAPTARWIEVCDNPTSSERRVRLVSRLSRMHVIAGFSGLSRQSS